jgi:hypothetical protein
MTADFSHALLRLIRTCVPSYQAAQTLLLFAANPERGFAPEEVVVSMHPEEVTTPVVREYITLFRSCGLVAEENGVFLYRPAAVELEQAVNELVRAYNERPVTLIRLLHHLG